MNNSVEGPIKFPLSDDTRNLLASISGLSQFIPEIEEVCGIACNVLANPPSKPSDVLKGMEKLRKALTATIEALDALPFQSYMQLSANASDRAINTVLGDFSRNVAFIEEVVNVSLEEYSPKQGRRPIYAARILASRIVEIFDKAGICATRSENGPFVVVMDRLFADVLPHSGPEAYRRHAAWALDNRRT